MSYASDKSGNMYCDWYSIIFQVSAERYLDVDKEDISDELECIDLNQMAINKINYLSGKSIGTASRVKTMTSSCSGMPIFTKSLNL